MKMVKFDKLTETLLSKYELNKSISMVSSTLELSDELSYFSIGENTKLVNAHVTIMEGGRLTIGNFCEIRGRIIVGEGCTLEIGHGLSCNDAIKIQIAEYGKVIIGNDCLFANPKIFNSDMHSIFSDDTGQRLNKAKDVLIGNRVWLATDCLILKGTNIECDSVVGAGAITSGFYEKKSLIVGNPARVVKSNVCWTRSLKQNNLIKFDDNFSLADFRACATSFEHKKVIDMAGKYIEYWVKMDGSNYFIFYYLARSILISKFKEKNVFDFFINNKLISIELLADILQRCFEMSDRKNYICGAYAYLACKMAGKEDIANVLYREILPVWEHISDHRFKENWAA